MKKIWIVDLESVETRYTSQWKTALPQAISDFAEEKNLTTAIQNLFPTGAHKFPSKSLSSVQFNGIKHMPQYQKDVIILPVEGVQTSTTTTPGAFLNFASTNVYKSTQMESLSNAFEIGLVEDDDYILFTDAWHPGVIQVKYMIELMDLKTKVGAIFHAGSYDPYDFLGRKIKNKDWSYSFERSLCYALDDCFFATEFHMNLIEDQLFYDCKRPSQPDGHDHPTNFVRSGQPHNLLVEHLQTENTDNKKDLILFPHRIAPEKQPEIFKDLAISMPEYEWVICQNENLTKKEYHKLLAESKMVFSASLQETLGIGAMEAVMVNSLPMLPDRLSYQEMYDRSFLYPSSWTTNFESYTQHKSQIIEHIKHKMDNFHKYQYTLNKQKQLLLTKYLNATEMFKRMF